MREYLFRGKKADKWEYGNLEVFSDDVAFIRYNAEYFNRVIPETVGQFTGLEDRNGVKIFEGDVVKGTAYSAEWRGVIVWIAEIASFGVRYIHRGDPTAWENSSILRALKHRKDEFSAEVIGNIYDNPELLQQNK